MTPKGNIVLPANEPTKVWNPLFIKLFIVYAVMTMGQFMMNTLIPKYADHLGASSSVVGLITSMFAITALGMRVFSGPATLSFSKKKIVAIASLTIATAFCLYGLSTSIPMVMVARLLHGCGISFSSPTALAMASDALPRNKLGAGIGYFSMGQALSMAIGPSIGLSMIDTIGYNAAFFIGAAVMVVASVMMFTLRYSDKAAKKPFKISVNAIIAKEAMIPMVLILFIMMASSNVNAFIVLFAESRNVVNIGLYFTVNAIVMLITRPLVASVSDRLGVRKILLPAMIFVALSFVLIGISTTLPMFLMAATVSAIGFGSCQPAIQTLCIKSVAPQRRGVGGCTNFVGMDIGALSGPIMAGAIVDKFGYATMYFSLVVPIVIAIAVFIIFYGKIKAIERQTNDAPENQENLMESAG